MPQNPQIHLVSRPAGEPTADNFKLLTLDTPALQDRQVLVK
ncbi:MAG: NADP-dependent oxidoreductase, partial [Betaproteobacteria bacterium]|nr:NADP-dependent oxidoreductase [Betaproteobacteria bacterium]